MPRTDIAGNAIPDPGERCDACNRPLLWTDGVAVPVRTQVVGHEEAKNVLGKTYRIRVGKEGTARVCPVCAPLLEAAG